MSYEGGAEHRRGKPEYYHSYSDNDYNDFLSLSSLSWMMRMVMIIMGDDDNFLGHHIHHRQMWSIEEASLSVCNHIYYHDS